MTMIKTKILTEDITTDVEAIELGEDNHRLLKKKKNYKKGPTPLINFLFIISKMVINC